MSTLVFIDTETTGLSLDDEIWEFAAIRREEDGTETVHHMFVEHDTERCAALPPSFRDDHRARFPISDTLDWHEAVVSRAEAARLIHELTADRPHIVGAVPNFDTERMAILLAKYGFTPSWHYHLIDVEALAVGHLNTLARWIYSNSEGDNETVARAEALRATARPPWKSDDLSRALGVEPDEEARHTALGDARWARDIYDAVIDGPAAR